MRKIAIALAVLLLLTFSVHAAETDELKKALPDEAADYMPETTETTDFWDAVRSILLAALGDSKQTVSEALRLCAVLLGVMLLCALVKMSAGEQISTAVATAGALGLCAACVGTFHSMLGLAVDTVEKMTDYHACLLPVLSSALAMQGSVSSSAALYSGTILFSQLLMRLITKLLVPLTYFFLAVATAEAALDSDMLSELRDFIGWLISKSLRILLYLFIAYLALTGVISGTADAAAVKATKAAMSGMVPVVGSILSDASESVLAGASLLKSSVGVFGMLAVLAVCILPFLRVGVHYLMLKITAAVSGTVGLKAHVGLMKRFSTAMGYLLGMCGACGLMSLLSVVCFLRVTV